MCVCSHVLLSSFVASVSHVQTSTLVCLKHSRVGIAVIVILHRNLLHIILITKHFIFFIDDLFYRRSSYVLFDDLLHCCGSYL